MIRKVMLRLDVNRIDPLTLSVIVHTSQSLRQLDRASYEFQFEDMDLVHAVSLLKSGSESNRLLGLYLNSVVYVLETADSDPFIALDLTLTDFKRIVAEHLGVGLSSLFMVNVFGVEWETISQLPINKSFSKLTPDFKASSPTEEYLYESKGTTQADKVSGLMNDATGQVKSYPGRPLNRKLAFVSYIPSSRSSFPATMFLADPVSKILPTLDRESTLMLHYKSVFDYAQMIETSSSLLDLLKQKFRLDIAKGHAREFEEKDRYEKLEPKLEEAFARDRHKVTTFEHEGKIYVGKWLDTYITNFKTRIFMGVDTQIAEKITKGQFNIKRLEGKKDAKGHRVSIFSDGTILQMSIELTSRR